MTGLADASAADAATVGWAVRVPCGYRVGRWTVTEPIATGGWGSVYAARREDGAGPAAAAGPPREAALKFLPTGTLTPRQVGQLADMAARETRNHRLLAHPRLIRAFETLVVDDPARPVLDGAVVIVMERATGSLRDLILRSGDGPVPGAPRLAAQICAGLAYLHGAGWVHGDIKPANVLMMADGSVRLSDLGLADELHGTHAYAPPVASPDFAPPERWDERMGERGFATRPSADVWALGVTAHLLLSGAHPFDGATPHARALAAARYAAGAAPLTLSAELPAGWDGVIRDCLAPTHDRRRAHPADLLLTRMNALAGEEPADQIPASQPPPDHPPLEPISLEPISPDGPVPDGDAAAALSAGGSAARGGGPRPGARRRLAFLAATLVTATAATLGVFTLGDSGDRQESPGRQTSAAGGASPAASGPASDQLLRGDAGIPARYRQLIVDAGRACREPGLSPALVAAMLRVESNFDPDLADPARGEYGIARWTPSVLRYYLPDGQRDAEPHPPFPPEISIPAVGRFLCFLGPRLVGVPGDAGLLLAAAYRTSATAVVRSGGPPADTLGYVGDVRRFRDRYDPRTPAAN
ncbi:Protein kinase [Frankia canadensis]|uniref:non-specific serine/threonine protein kinase n=1 Tax=Frankia canadensis TaxID=1836972 RepID=A0A2I2KYE5_9ACTN|nr:protein kinase [Frankia canadensis]SNQ50685.1 Protein kinase [Frankia canadensis]SOU57975.1 Protein kinase [Frankia canadensis]